MLQSTHARENGIPHGTSHAVILASPTSVASSLQPAARSVSRKKLALTLVALSLVLGIITILYPRRPRISMNIVEYRKWPHGVMLRLTNGTSAAINYVAE